ncbi:MAG: molybdenum ABC transporter permease subunit [Alphaproteobacteria bacterium RIFCSPLOWO2_01_FULL_40_26]|nr:MAG: molybdenum ABC transporter permease subunit [Alphaproteobacteria bacterium RIFCSPHIGHO2_02_FULL_40_34]OFW85475.1 MAG: molybdenum ABC transporter permease subunit [Alphaproteobacteria bacterium RIFCSPHIGHO2_01_FULL_40_8]OFW94788.1 MAG: molybdenum ABC transporter permease subunit [Alphaproteobacteria bacterium RIFCSPLOWO2_01_FULL_40_26]OFX10417.1 MAG: molybdenum ABC transporter permease subunit [Alphaproteobacteria bacterium RIFCSPLOWO2_02_FULL_40_19]OFX11310.1 MAG: molybdenum ABC transpo
MDLSSLFLSLKLATITTAILLLVGTPIAYFLSQKRGKIKSLIEALVLLPLILPPTILGFYLLVLLGPNGFIGSFWKSFSGGNLTFSFAALVIGSVVYSLPFVVKPIQNSFETIDKNWLEIASTLRASKWKQFTAVILPLSRGGFISAIVFGFIHTMGEFGVVLMLGGNIPGKTKTISIAIYDYVELLEYNKAHMLSLILVVFCLLSLVLLFMFGDRRRGGADGWN